MDRRQFLIGTAAAAVAGRSLAAVATDTQSPYGPMLPPDENGIRLPAGFRSRVVARSGVPVGVSGYVWHVNPDGGACFPQRDGGWIYTSNSEIGAPFGGVGALRFSPAGELVDAYRILDGTSTNCAGGATPWGTWLSCEETSRGRVWECDPTGARAAVVRPALGVMPHEAVAVDPRRRRLYMTEDHPTGRFYRFTPAAYPSLDAGELEVLALDGDRGRVSWLPVPDPSAATVPTNQQVPASKAFKGGEGLWYDSGVVYFTTKGDDRLWSLDTASDRLDVLYDAAAYGADAPLTGVDNVTVHGSGDIFVAEDGGSMDIVLITPDGAVARFLQIVGQDDSEVAGPAFDPSGTRLYFSSQRGGVASLAPDAPGTRLGVTYEVTGPFRGPVAATPRTEPITGATQPVAATGAAAGAGRPAVAGLALLAGALRLRTRRPDATP